MISTREVNYDVDGLTMVAHLAQPVGEGPWPAVLIGHDGIGLDGYQRARADDLAEHGYLTLAMDYHGGQVFFGHPEAMLARVMPLLADADRMQAIGRASLDVLMAVPGADPDRLAALGYGAGGRIVLELASVGVPFKAVAVVHPDCLRHALRTGPMWLASSCCVRAPKIRCAARTRSWSSLVPCRARASTGA